MKKCLSILACLAFIVIAIVGFTACGNKKQGEDVYQMIKSQMEVMLQEGTPFKTAKSNGVQSDFILTNFYKKISDNTTVDYGWHDELIATGLNYVQEYYPLAQKAKPSNVTKLKKSQEKLNESFKVLKEEFENTKKISSSEDMTIYNGFMAKYAESARNFEMQVFEYANEVSEYLNNALAIEDITLQFYYDSQVLKMLDDCNNFYIINCEATVGQLQISLLDLQKKDVKSSLTEEKVDKMKKLFYALENERKLTEMAMKKFSYYDYIITYNGDVSAYEKVLPLAKAYLGQITKYHLKSENYLSQTYEYLINNIAD